MLQMSLLSSLPLSPLYQMMGSEPQSQVKQSPRLQAGWHLRDGAGPELGSGQVSG